MAVVEWMYRGLDAFIHTRASQQCNLLEGMVSLVARPYASQP